MNHQRLLRLFILTDVFAAIGSVIASILFEHTLPEPLRTYADAEEPQTVFLILAFILVVLLIAAWVGLWRRAAWAPAVYAVMWVGCVVILPFSGPHVGTGVDELFDFVGTAAGGAILALLLVEREERRRAALPGADPASETPAGAESPDRPDEELPSHVKAGRVHRGLSWLYALVTIMLLALPFTDDRGTEGLDSPREIALALIFPLFFFTLFILHHVVSRGARKRKRWARIGSILLACLLLPGVPIGTLLGVYLLRNSTWEPRSPAATVA